MKTARIPAVQASDCHNQPKFSRAEPRSRLRCYVSGLVAGLERKNGWTLELL
jgi:hypothetical protein